MARTHSPTRSVSESPSGANGSGRGDSTLISAMSVSGSDPTRSAREVASMFTTAGFRRSAISANDTDPDVSVVTAAALVGAGRTSGAEIAGAGVMEPATTRPTRNATVAVSVTVTATKRRVIAT